MTFASPFITEQAKDRQMKTFHAEQNSGRNDDGHGILEARLMKFVKIIIPVIAGILLVAGSPLAHAVKFDFGAIADGNEGALADGHLIIPSDGSTDISVAVSASGPGGSEEEDGDPFAYLDSRSGGKLAGLGVCKDLDSDNGADTGTSGSLVTATQAIGGDDCDPSNDDNLTTAELLKLSFTEIITITDALFRDADHNEFGDPEDAQDPDLRDFYFCIGSDCDDAGDDWIHDFMGDPDELIGSEGMMFSFIVDDVVCDSPCDFYNDRDQLYISVLDVVGVPEPASLLLLGIGLIGLGRFTTRRALG